MANFTGQPISASYLRLLQIDGGAIQDGLGSTISNATIGSLTGSFSGSLRGTATSASFAVTASYALNAGGGTGVGFPFTGSARITGSLGVTGSFSQRSDKGTFNFLNSDPITNTVTLRNSTLFLTGSSDILAGADTIINLSGIFANKGALTIPVSTTGTKEMTGSMYYDDAANVLYIYNSTNGWQGFEPTI